MKKKRIYLISVDPTLSEESVGSEKKETLPFDSRGRPERRAEARASDKSGSLSIVVQKPTYSQRASEVGWLPYV